jgi:hypothetical protein
VQRGSLVPVPDVLQYKDQLGRDQPAHGRIHALSDALEAKGFYPAGGAELADAVQAAMRPRRRAACWCRSRTGRRLAAPRRVIIWLPIDMIAQTITALVTLRKQVIDDIYQITGTVRHHARLDRPERDAGRAADEDAVRLDAHPRQAAGDGAPGARPGGDHLRDHHREVRPRHHDRDEPDAAADQRHARGRRSPAWRQQLQGSTTAMQMAQSPQVQQMAQSDPQQAQQMMQRASS